MYQNLETVAVKTGISMEALKRAIKDGDLISAQVGRTVMISEEALRQWLDGLTKKTKHEERNEHER